MVKETAQHKQFCQNKLTGYPEIGDADLALRKPAHFEISIVPIYYSRHTIHFGMCIQNIVRVKN